jgi:uncharacterized membrane protein
VPNELIHPNWHVILVHYPLALLTMGLAIELLSFLYRHSTLRNAGRWMLLIGALACVPTATSGLYAYYDTVRYAGQGEVGMEPGGDAWYQLTRGAEGHLAARQWEDLKHHIWRMGSGTIILLLAVLPYVGASDRWRGRLYVPCLVLVMFAVGVLVWGAWYAGESIHTQGTAVERDATRLVIDPKQPGDALRGVFPPLQVHVLFAGLTIAMAMGALGLSIRRLSTRDAVQPAPTERDTHDVAYSDSPALQVKLIVVGEPVYPARFWLLAAVLGLATAAAGVWVAGWTWDQLQPLLGQPRDLMHIVLGASIILLALILAGLIWSGRGRAWTIGAVAMLLLLVVGAQVWVGILLMYDGSDRASSLYQFRRPTVQDTGGQGR